MKDLLVVEDLAEAAEVVGEVAAKEIHLFDLVVGDALRGRSLAVSAYLKGWKALESRFLELVRERRPDAVLERDGRVFLVDVKGFESSIAKDLLNLAAMNAPFSPLVLLFGVGRGVALYLLSEIRRTVPDLYPLVPERVMEFPSWDISQRDFSVFIRRVLLAEIEEQPPLERVVQVFALSETELGSLFGVRRQAVSPWLEGNVPANRTARVQTIASIADVLERNLNTHAIPGVVRRRAEVYGDHSILEMIQLGREAEVFAQLQRTFDWVATA